MRIVFSDGQADHMTTPVTCHDIVFAPNLVCKDSDQSVFEKLMAELETADKNARTPGELFVPWHGDNHLIANDRVSGGKWKDQCPTLASIFKRMESYFNMKINATRVNYYQPGVDSWKPFHHDRAALVENTPQNFTVAVSLGATRDVAFEHARSTRVPPSKTAPPRTTVSMAAPNGSAYCFARDVNIEWKHAVMPVMAGDPPPGGRISIIAWGEIRQSFVHSRVTTNPCPSAADLGIRSDAPPGDEYAAQVALAPPIHTSTASSVAPAASLDTARAADAPASGTGRAGHAPPRGGGRGVTMRPRTDRPRGGASAVDIGADALELLSEAAALDPTAPPSGTAGRGGRGPRRGGK